MLIGQIKIKMYIYFFYSLEKTWKTITVAEFPASNKTKDVC